MMSLFLIAALGLARDQTFLKLGEVTSLKESAAPLESAKDEFQAQLLVKEEADKAAQQKIDQIQKDTAKDLTRLVDQQKPELKFTKDVDQMTRWWGVPVPFKIKKNEDKLKNQIKSITTNLATLNGAMGTTGQLSASHSDVVKRYVTQIEELQKQVNELSIKVTQHEEEKNKHLQEIAQAKASSEATIGQKGDAESEEQRNKQLIADLKNENSALQQELLERREEIERIEQQQAFNNGSMNGLEENQNLIVNIFQDKIQKLEEKIGQLNENKIEQEKELEKMTNQVAEQSEKTRSLERHLFNAEYSNEELTKSFDEMKHAYAKKLSSCEARANNPQEEINTDYDHEDKKVVQLRSTAEKASLDEKETIIENLKYENKKLKDETQRQKESLDEMKAYQARQEEKLQALEAEINHAEEVIKRNTELQAQIKTQQRKIDGLNEDVAKLEAAKNVDRGYETDSGRASPSSIMGN